MYEDIMRRPMFQTPQQRERSGIMAGVVPVRGYAEGGEVEQDPSFMDYLRVAPSVLDEMIVGEDDTMSDFFSFEKTPEGQGLNLRDLTDFFIVDPDDPTDVAIGTATAGLMATGVGAPGAIAARLGRMGFKGKKVAEKVEKAIRLGAGETRGKTFGRGQTARFLAEVPEIMADEQQSEMPELGGITSLMIDQSEGPEKNYNVGVDKGGVPFKESFAYHKAKGDEVFTWDGELYTTDVDDEPVGMSKGGFTGLLSRLKDKTKKMLKRKPKEEEQMELFDDLPADLPVDSPSRTRRAIDFAKRRPVVTGAGGVGGIALLLDQLAGDDEEAAEDALDQLGDTLDKQEATAQGAGFTLNQMPNLPAVVVPEAPEEEVEVEAEAEEPRRKVLPGFRPFGGKVARALLGDDEAFGGDRGAIDFIRKPEEGGFFDQLQEKLTDPRTRYQLAQAAKPTEGFVPRNFFTDMEEAGQQYDLLQKEKQDDTALTQNLKFLKELKPDASTDELLDLLLSKDTTSETKERYQDTLLTLFTESKKDPENSGRNNEDLLREAASDAALIVFGGASPLGGMSSQTADVVMSEEEVKRRTS